MTLYAELGVAANATPEEIKAAYRVAAQRSHPDKEGGDEDKFKRVGEAFTVLSNPERRAEYDRTGSTAEGPTVEAEATQMMRSLFNNYLDGQSTQDPLKFMRESITVADSQRRSQLDQEDKLIAKLHKLRTRLKAPGIIADTLEFRLQAAKLQQTALARGELVLIAMRELLASAEYDSSGEPPAVSEFNYMTYSRGRGL